MDSELDLTKEEMKEKRGRMLTVLCVLSWIFIGITFFANIMGVMKGQASVEELNEQKILLVETYDNFGLNQGNIEDTLLALDKTNEHFYLNYSTSIIFGLIGFFAVFQMYKLQKMGFWMYIAYSIIPMGVTFYILEGVEGRIGGLAISFVISAIFIGLYASQLKRLE